MTSTDSPDDVFAHRKQKFSLIRDHLTAEEPSDTRGPSGPRRKENEERLLTLVLSGALPWSDGYHPEGYSDTWGVYTNYSLQIFFSVGERIVKGDWSREELLRYKAEKERRLDQGIGKPSATDGSKGQWRAGLKNGIRACEWFLGEWDGTEWMHDAGLTKAPEGWKPDPDPSSETAGV